MSVFLVEYVDELCEYMKGFLLNIVELFCMFEYWVVVGLEVKGFVVIYVL